MGCKIGIMERNKHLTEIRKFKHEDHFKSHVNALLKHLYPQAKINQTTIEFTQEPYKGLTFVIYSDALHPFYNMDFKMKYPKMARSGEYNFEELVNTWFKVSGGSGKLYMYPRDRNMFEDSLLGMEQKAIYFVMIMEITLKWMINDDLGHYKKTNDGDTA